MCDIQYTLYGLPLSGDIEWAALHAVLFNVERYDARYIQQARDAKAILA